jgi:phospholipid/cholesterol/gamma-HCH transport system ATP-binding protein
VTHDLDSIYTIADRVAVLVDQELRIGTIDEMRRDQNPWIARYFGGPRGRAAEVRNEPDAEHRG